MSDGVGEGDGGGKLSEVVLTTLLMCVYMVYACMCVVSYVCVCMCVWVDEWVGGMQSSTYLGV